MYWTIETTKGRQVFNWNQKILKENGSTVGILSGRCIGNDCKETWYSGVQWFYLWDIPLIMDGKDYLHAVMKWLTKKKIVKGNDKIWIFRVDRNSDRSCGLLMNKSSGSNKIMFYILQIKVWKTQQSQQSCKQQNLSCRNGWRIWSTNLHSRFE